MDIDLEEDEDSSDEEYCPDGEEDEDEDTVEEVIAGSCWMSILTLFWLEPNRVQILVGQIDIQFSICIHNKWIFFFLCFVNECQIFVMM